MSDLPDLWKVFVENAERELDRDLHEPGSMNATNIVVCVIITRPYGILLWPAALAVAWHRRRKAQNVADAIIRAAGCRNP